MFEIKPRDKMVERALLVGACFDAADKADAEDLLEELGELVQTLGIPIVEKKLVLAREPQARYLVGSGKAEEIRERLEELNCDVVIFDNELTPAQQRNWEQLTKVLVIDRQEIRMAIGVRNVERMISQRLRPSIPTCQWISGLAIQMTLSTNCWPVRPLR